MLMMRIQRRRQNPIPPNPSPLRPTARPPRPIQQRPLHIDRKRPSHQSPLAAATHTSHPPIRRPKTNPRFSNQHRNPRSRIPRPHPTFPSPSRGKTTWHTPHNPRLRSSELQSGIRTAWWSFQRRTDQRSEYGATELRTYETGTVIEGSGERA